MRSTKARCATAQGSPLSHAKIFRHRPCSSRFPRRTSLRRTGFSCRYVSTLNISKPFHRHRRQLAGNQRRRHQFRSRASPERILRTLNPLHHGHVDHTFKPCRLMEGVPTGNQPNHVPLCVTQWSAPSIFVADANPIEQCKADLPKLHRNVQRFFVPDERSPSNTDEHHQSLRPMHRHSYAMPESEGFHGPSLQTRTQARPRNRPDTLASGGNDRIGHDPKSLATGIVGPFSIDQDESSSHGFNHCDGDQRKTQRHQRQARVDD